MKEDKITTYTSAVAVIKAAILKSQARAAQAVNQELLAYANIFEGRISDKIRYAGDLIKIIHAHDNDGSGDLHLHPYDGNVDWADLAEGLFDIGFDGVFNLETAPVKEKRLKEGISDEEVREAEIALAKTAKLIAG